MRDDPKLVITVNRWTNWHVDLELMPRRITTRDEPSRHIEYASRKTKRGAAKVAARLQAMFKEPPKIKILD